MIDDIAPDVPGQAEFSFEYVRPGKGTSTFRTQLLHADESRVVLTHVAHPSHPLHSGGSEVIGAGYSVVWFLYQGKPWDLGRFYRPDGTWTGYYVDILEPVTWSGSESPQLSALVDLALDVWIDTAGTFTVLDEDEFSRYVNDGTFTPAQEHAARTVLSQLLSEIEKGTFPPDDVKNFALPGA